MKLDIYLQTFNLLTPNVNYSGRTAPLTSKRCILYIYSTNIGTQYFKHGIYSPFFSKCILFQNSNVFGSCIIHILYTGCAKIKKKQFRRQKVNSPKPVFIYITIRSWNLSFQNILYFIRYTVYALSHLFLTLPAHLDSFLCCYLSLLHGKLISTPCQSNCRLAELLWRMAAF